MLSLTTEERKRIDEGNRMPTNTDLDDSSNDEAAPLPPRPAAQPAGAEKLARRMKDKLTNTTHEEREARRRKRDEEEHRAYVMHQRIRAAMVKAEQTGEPQLLGRDSEGKEVYIEPPSRRVNNRLGGGGYGMNGYGYNPFTQGPYGYPNSSFMRPPMPYSRPMGYGYGGGYGRGLGGGYGMPLMGLGGGLMLGSMLF